MACLEVLDIPSAASTDDLGVLVAQFAPVLRMLLLSHGPSTPGSALVWVAADDAAAVADALDSHPLAGGLISVRLCTDPMRWVVSSVGTEQLIGIGSATQAHAAHATPPAQQSQPPTPVPQPLAHPAPGRSSGGSRSEGAHVLSSGGTVSARESARAGISSGGGVAEMEAELRQLQEQLQAQALEGGFAGWQAEPGDGWEQGGGSSRGSADGDAEEDGSWQVAGRSGASVQQVRGSHGNSSSSGGSSSQDSRSTLAVHHIDPAQDHRQLFHFFKRYGYVEQVIKSPSAQHAVVRFKHPSAAQAAVRALNGQLVPELNPAGEVHAELREQGQQAALGRETGSAVPTTKLWVGHIAPEATIGDLTRVFSKFGPIYAPELRRAPESGRRDQWAFVNFKRLQDAEAAYAALRFRVVRQLSGDLFLKLQYRPV